VSEDITKIQLALGTNFNTNSAAVTVYGDNQNYPDPDLLTATFGGIPLLGPSNPGNNPLPLTVINIKAGKRTITAGTPNLLACFDNSTGATGFFAQRTNPLRPQRSSFSAYLVLAPRR